MLEYIGHSLNLLVFFIGLNYDDRCMSMLPSALFVNQSNLSIAGRKVYYSPSLSLEKSHTPLG